MPSNASLAKDLEKRFKQYAPEKNRDKIGHVLEVFKEKKNIDYRTVVNLVMALSSPSILGKAGQEKADRKYDTFLSKYADGRSYGSNRLNANRRDKFVDKMEAKANRLRGWTWNFSLKIGLYAQAKKLNPDPPEELQKNAM